MPQPTASDLHIDAALTNVSVAYIQSADHFISSRVFPRVPVMKQSDKYWTYTKADWFRDEAKKRADATESAGSGYNVSSTQTYFAHVKAIHKDIGSQARANADEAFNLEMDATRFVTQRLLLAQEIEWASVFFSSGVWTGETVVSSSVAWSNVTNGDPIQDLETGKQSILSITGFEPNTLVLGYSAFRALKHHPDIVDRIKHTGGPGTDPIAALASVVGIDRVLISRSIKNTANEAATASYSFSVGGQDALLCYSAPSPGLLQPSAGYAFTWNGPGLSGGLGTDVAISRIDIPTKKATRIEGEQAIAYELVSADLGYFFANASTF